MPSVKPNCIECHKSENVKLLSGGTHGFYRYTCKVCSCKWQQRRPESITIGSAPEVKICKRKSSSNRCSICLQPKKNHVCTGFKLSMDD